MRLLVVKLADIGDVLTATPALRALRASLPGAHISVLVTPGSAAVLRDLPSVDDLILFDKFGYDRPWDALRPRSLAAALQFVGALRAGHYDVTLILHHLTTRWGALKYAGLALSSGAGQRLGLDNGRGWFLTGRVRDRGFGDIHEVEYWLEVVGLVGAHTGDRRLEIAVGDPDRAWAEQAAGRPFAVIHPGSGGYILTRRWPPERFAQVGDALSERYGLPVALVGGPGEENLVQTVAAAMRHPPINLAGRTSIKQLAALLARCSLFIGGDSGVMHVAAAAGAPVVALFGPTNERAWGPYTPQGSGLRATVVRAPGTHPVMYVGHRLGKQDAALGKRAMAAITPAMVLAAVERVLGTG